MKGQQIFYSFLPGVTAAVLTTQPAWAVTVKVNGVQLAASPSVSTSTYGRTLVADIANQQLPSATGNSSPSLAPYPEWMALNVKPVNQDKIPLIARENFGLKKAQVLRKNESRFFSLTSTSSANQQLDQNLSAQSNRQQSHLGQKSENLVVPTAVQQTTFSLSSSQQPLVQRKSPDAQSQNVLQTVVTSTGAAKLLQIPSCSLEKASLLQSSRACLQKIDSGERVVQNMPTKPGNVIPAPAGSGQVPTTPGNVIPAPAGGSGQVPTTPGNVIPAPADPRQVLDNLNPSPNPLQFPTKPEEVMLQSNQPITLAQALELAQRNNRDLQVAILTRQRSQEALREAQAALLPTVGISTSVTRQRSTSETLQTKLEEQAQEGLPEQLRSPVDSAQANTSFTGQAQLSYSLYTSGQRQASIRAAEEQLRSDELAVESSAEDIRLNVSTDYYNLQQADEQVRISQSAVQNAQASLKDAEALERAGVGTRFDVLRSQVNLANSQQTLTNAISQQQIARRQLATRISLTQSVNISAADPVKLAGLWNQSLEQSIVLAFQNRPELQQQLAQRNISEQQRRQALASLGPQVSLVATYDLLDQFDDGVGVSDGYSVGVRATLNLFDGGAARARAAQQKVNIAIAETNFANQRNQIRFQVEQAFSTQKSNLENVQTANTALEQAREALRLARLRFQAGVGTQTDVINSENDLTVAEGNRVRAILDYNRALAQLQRSVTFRAFRQ
ncbi:TolC family protein [Calothrix sp. PCC 7507]|uniref:TolC family protein n=1 Tax=Calothrix sp. PCC 7507 TaxID=99598 RepID=UPI00029F1422|nr:TolC family protein [Calothrix sp. PCC 7507]AFY35527.1 outer membrane efflux protein [Calothrix sp. PCC 7507]